MKVPFSFWAAQGSPPAVCTVVAISPAMGSTLGGTGVSIQVDDSTGAISAAVGGVNITSFAIVDGTHVSGYTCAHAAGAVDVTVTNGAGTSAPLVAAFTYAATFLPADFGSALIRAYDTGAGHITTGGGFVTAAADQSGNGKNLVTGGADPVYGVATIDGFDTIQGINQFLQHATPADWKFLHDGSDFTVYCMAHAWSTTQFYNTNDNDVSKIGNALLEGGSGSIYDQFGTGTAAPNYIMASFRSPHDVVDTTTYTCFIQSHKNGKGRYLRQAGNQETADAAIAAYNSGNPFSNMIIGGAGGALYWLEFGCINRYIDPNDAKALEDGFLAKYPSSWQNRRAPTTYARIFYSGNSLMAGVATTVFPDLIRASLANPIVFEHLNGISGQTTEQMKTRDLTRIDNWIDPDAGINIAIGWEGINSINSVGDSPTLAATRMQEWATARYAAGVDAVLVSNMLPNALVSEPDRTTYNGLIAAGEGVWFDVLIDVASDANIGQAGDNTDPTYYNVDEIHLNATGYAVAGPYFAAAIDVVWP